MTVAGTLYEETIKLGYGKLLSTQTVTNAVSINFITPFTSEFHCYHFDILYMYPDTGSVIGYQVTQNSGASWLTSGYMMTYFYMCSHGGPAYGASGNYDLTYHQLSGGGRPNNPFVAEMKLIRRPGYGTQYYFQSSVVNPTYNHHHLAGGGCQDNSINGIRFIFNAGIITSGAIRCYGLRLGA